MSRMTSSASHERFQLAAIGIEKGKPFQPGAQRRKLFDEAAQFASAIARNNSFASEDPARLVYPDRVWEWAFIGGSAAWDSQGYINTDRRATFAYIASACPPQWWRNTSALVRNISGRRATAAARSSMAARAIDCAIPPNIPGQKLLVRGGV